MDVWQWGLQTANWAPCHRPLGSPHTEFNGCASLHGLRRIDSFVCDPLLPAHPNMWPESSDSGILGMQKFGLFCSIWACLRSLIEFFKCRGLGVGIRASWQIITKKKHKGIHYREFGQWCGNILQSLGDFIVSTYVGSMSELLRPSEASSAWTPVWTLGWGLPFKVIFESRMTACLPQIPALIDKNQATS